ncbi:MAG: hypothetical protein ACXV2C_00165 [Candidatus Bathyarchaeia archaeon]
MNRRELIVGAAASAVLIPFGIKAAQAAIIPNEIWPERIYKTAYFSDEMVADCQYLGYIPEFFTAEKLNDPILFNSLPGMSWYKVAFVRSELRYVDPINFEPYIRPTSPGDIHFTIVRSHRSEDNQYSKYDRELTMRIYEDGTYIASIFKVARTSKRTGKTHLISAIDNENPPNLNNGWKKVVW